MRLGRFWATKATNNGFGWLSIETPVRLWGCMSAIAPAPGRERSGTLYLLFIDNAPSAECDFWEAYETVLPSKRHRAVGKNSGQTTRIERFNCTLRQRVSRLVRKTLSFSKKLENHIGAIWSFIHHYNASLQP